jgi:hypothetical protein
MVQTESMQKCTCTFDAYKYAKKNFALHSHVILVSLLAQLLSSAEPSEEKQKDMASDGQAYVHGPHPYFPAKAPLLD